MTIGLTSHILFANSPKMVRVTIIKKKLMKRKKDGGFRYKQMEIGGIAVHLRRVKRRRQLVKKQKKNKLNKIYQRNVGLVFRFWSWTYYILCTISVGKKNPIPYSTLVITALGFGKLFGARTHIFLNQT